MSEIRIKSDNKVIKVNEKGETITLPFSDATFPQRFFGMGEKIEKEQKKLTEKAAQIEGGDAERMMQEVKLYAEFHEAMAAQIEELFGTGTCEKVFDTKIPSAGMIAEFFDALHPFFEEYAKKMEGGKFDKYSPDRTGNV
jgi:hypothetical protein